MASWQVFWRGLLRWDTSFLAPEAPFGLSAGRLVSKGTAHDVLEGLGSKNSLETATRYAAKTGSCYPHLNNTDNETQVPCLCHREPNQHLPAQETPDTHRQARVLPRITTKKHQYLQSDRLLLNTDCDWKRTRTLDSRTCSSGGPPFLWVWGGPPLA